MRGIPDHGREARRLSLSRSRWKARAALKQRHILYLRVKARDLQASRDSWRLRALAAESALPPSQGPTLGES